MLGVPVAANQGRPMSAREKDIMTKIEPCTNANYLPGEVYILIGSEMGRTLIQPFRQMCTKVGLKVTEIENN